MAQRGSCLCGAVHYEVEVDPSIVFHCHCSICRKAHGAAFATFGYAPEGRFRWTRGEELLSHFESTPGSLRWFCSRCGTPLAGTGEALEGRVAVSLGSMEDGAGVLPTDHVFVDSKAPWFEVTDSLPRADDWPTKWSS